LSGGAGIQHLGDIRMVHQRERLAFGLEAGEDVAGIHAGFDDLESHFALDGLGLLGHPNHAHAAFADLLQELVGANDHAGAFAGWGGRLIS